MTTSTFLVTVPFEPVEIESLDSTLTTRLPCPADVDGIVIEQYGESYIATLEISATDRRRAIEKGLAEVKDLLRVLALRGGPFRAMLPSVKASKVPDTKGGNLPIETITMMGHVEVRQEPANLDWQTKVFAARNTLPAHISRALELYYTASHRDSACPE